MAAAQPNEPVETIPVENQPGSAEQVNRLSDQFASNLQDFRKNEPLKDLTSGVVGDDGFAIVSELDQRNPTGDTQATLIKTPTDWQTRVERDEIADLIRKNPDMLPDFNFMADGSATYTVAPGMTSSRLAIRALRFQAGPGKEGDFTAAERNAAAIQIANYNPDINLDSLRIGQVIKIPPEFITRLKPSPRVEVSLKSDSSVKVESANASAEFTQRIAELYSKLPPAMRNLLEFQTRIVVTGDIRDYHPSLFTEHPAAHPPNMTFSNVYGIHIPKDFGARSEVIIPEWYRGQDGKVVRNQYYKYAFNHEIGHALDRTLAPGSFSKTDQFINAYQADFNRMTPEQRKNYPYFTDGYVVRKPGSFIDFMSQARRAELFAELNAEILNTSLKDNAKDRKEFINSFRTTFEHMVKIQAGRNMISDQQYLQLADNGFLTPRLIAELQIIHRRSDLADQMRKRAGKS